MDAPSLHDLYERWAPLYHAEPHNPLMQAEQSAMLARLPRLAACCVLDLACGSGRYSRVLAERGAAYIAALDFSAAMLQRVTAGMPVQGDLTALPFRDSAFDFVICGLALGHAADLSRCIREIERVLAPGGTLLYSEFHPAALQRGQTRSFRDVHGELLTLPPTQFDRESHLSAIRAADLELVELFEPRAGIEFLADFPRASSFVRGWRGTPMLLIVQARKR